MENIKMSYELEDKLFRPSFNDSKNKFPLLDSNVSAGFPSPARDYIEDVLDLNELMVSHPAATYFVRVEGNSMSMANIFPGDILVVDRSKEAYHNSIIIAVLDGELTVKRLKIKNKIFWLYPENNTYHPIKIEEWMDFMVWGVVTWIIHKA